MSQMLEETENKKSDDNSSDNSMLLRKNTEHRKIGKINWHCCRVTAFNFWRYWPKRFRPCKTDKKERILMDHYN